MTALTVVPNAVIPLAARPLYDIELALAALLDTEDLVPADLEQQFALELQDALRISIEKRDRVAQFMAHLETQAAFAKAEAARLKVREGYYNLAFTVLESNVMRVIETLGLDAKGKRKKLEGTTVTFNARGCDKRAEVTDEQAVPAKYKRATVTLPAELWETVCDSLDLDLREQVLAEVRSAKMEVVTALVKADLKADIFVPGAQLGGGVYLERK